jgi:glycosyltransferase involved in cell wall biosynthesis
MPVSRDTDTVRRALHSVLSQDLTDVEVLIGDETGAGEPAAADAGDRRVDYHRNVRRLGFSTNHVALLDRARGRYMAVFHDDDRWEPQFLSSLVAVLDADPRLGLAACATVLADQDSQSLWPVPVGTGRHDDILDPLLSEDWFLLPISTIWRREVWTGPARQWPDLCCGDLQLFLSAADEGWSLYYLPEPLAHWVQHRGQSGAWRGADHGLRVADDVLCFWDGWLEGRPATQVARTSRQRAVWHLRRARALVLSGRPREARTAVARASALARAADLDNKALPGIGRMRLASHLPTTTVRAAVGLKRWATEGAPARWVHGVHGDTPERTAAPTVTEGLRH